MKNGARICEKIKNFIFSEKLLTAFFILLLSRVSVYADIAPLGISAIAAVGSVSEPLAILAFAVGISTAGMGFTSFLRHAFSLLSMIFLDKLSKGRIKRGLLSSLSVLSGGAASFLFRPFSFFSLANAAAEAALTFGFYILFREAKGILREHERRQNVTEAEFGLVFFTFLTLCLGLEGAEVGRLSLLSSALIFLSMGCAYKNRPALSSVLNMGTGFFFFIFAPENPFAACCLAVSGLIAPVVKKYGKIFVPLSYFVPLFVFYMLGMKNCPFSVYDVVLSSVIFMSVPSYVFDFIKPVWVKEEGKSFARISDRLSELEDTFSDIAETFDSINPCPSDNREKAAAISAEKICSDCYASMACRIDAASELRRFAYKMTERSTEEDIPENLRKYCRRKKELLKEFAGNYQLCRMEAMWQKRLSEETEAVSGQMKCISGVFAGLSNESEAVIRRDEAAEAEIKAALKKSGVNVRSISAGRTGRGLFEVRLSSSSCKGTDMCDTVIKDRVEKVIGAELEHIGIKNCKRCKIVLSSPAPYRINTVRLSVPFENVCGDSAAYARIDSEHYAIALSDGMGTGKNAAKDSSVAAHMALRLLSSGMDLSSTAKMINSLIMNRGGGKSFTTLDLALINVFTGKIEYLKNGAAAGYIYTYGGRVKKVDSEGSLLGALGTPETKVKKARLSDGDTLIMVSDGVCDAFGGDGEKAITQALSEYTFGTIEELAEFIIKKASAASGKKPKDDMTVIAAGCIRHKKAGNNMGEKEA